MEKIHTGQRCYEKRKECAAPLALLDVIDGYQLWSDVYDSENKNVIQIQTDIARAVVKALRVNALHP